MKAPDMPLPPSGLKTIVLHMVWAQGRFNAGGHIRWSGKPTATQLGSEAPIDRQAAGDAGGPLLKALVRWR